MQGGHHEQFLSRDHHEHDHFALYSWRDSQQVTCAFQHAPCAGARAAFVRRDGHAKGPQNEHIDEKCNVSLGKRAIRTGTDADHCKASIRLGRI